MIDDIDMEAKVIDGPRHSDGPRQDAGDGSGTEAAREEVRGLGQELKDETGRVAEEAKEQGRQLMGEARQRLRDEADRQTGRTVSGLRSVEGDLRSMAEGSEGQSGVATWVRRGADEIGSFADRLDRGGIDGVLDDVGGFARRNPTAFLATTFGIGFLAGRLMKNLNGEDTRTDSDLRGRNIHANDSDRPGYAASDELSSRPPRSSTISERPRP